MLEGLDRIHWGKLSHAYGEATDVPTQLRSLISADPDSFRETISTLHGNIWHQGTVYSATGAAVPFLYELLISPEISCKTDLAEILTSIADGVGYLEVHALGEYGETVWRGILAEQGKTLEEELELERQVTLSVRKAVSEGLPHLLPYLKSSDAGFRRALVIALENYPEQAALILPALDVLEASEKDQEVRAAILETKTRLIC